MTAPLILASQSVARARLLAAAGLDFETRPAEIDEAAIRRALEADGDMPADDVATVLAEAKATIVSEQHPGSLVIGADQVLEFEGRILGKAESIAEVRETLIEMRGKSHRLISAVVLCRGGGTVWRHTEAAELVMRDFTNEFLGGYLAKVGERVTETVGSYEIEAEGIQLFERVKGDIFTIQGLPLLALLKRLRKDRAIPE